MLHHLHQLMLERHHLEDILVGEGGLVEGIGDEARLIIEVDRRAPPKLTNRIRRILETKLEGVIS